MPSAAQHAPAARPRPRRRRPPCFRHRGARRPLACQAAHQARSICGSRIRLCGWCCARPRRSAGSNCDEPPRPRLGQRRRDHGGAVRQRRHDAGDVFQQHRQGSTHRWRSMPSGASAWTMPSRHLLHCRLAQAHALGRAGGAGGESDLGRAGRHGHGHAPAGAAGTGTRPPRWQATTGRARPAPAARAASSVSTPAARSAWPVCAGVKKSRQRHVHHAGLRGGKVEPPPRRALSISVASTCVPRSRSRAAKASTAARSSAR
jgi:hypothetical protein